MRVGFSSHCEERSDAAISHFLGLPLLRRNKAISGAIMGGQFYVYIMTNKSNTVLYTGITGDLKKRVYQHKGEMMEGFTRKYKIVKLVYYEVFGDPENAILREKKIKAGSRQKKIELINSQNKDWLDLYPSI